MTPIPVSMRVANMAAHGAEHNTHKMTIILDQAEDHIGCTVNVKEVCRLKKSLSLGVTYKYRSRNSIIKLP